MTGLQCGRGDMSMTNIIIGVVLGVLAAGLIIGSAHRHRQVFSTLFVVGIVALAVTLTIVREQQATDQTAANPARSRPPPPSDIAAGSPPPIALPSRSPMATGPTGSA